MQTQENCPFCGSSKQKIEYKSKDITHRHVRQITMSVRCNRCHARGGTVSGEIPDMMFGTPQSDRLTTVSALEQRAWEAWNRRAANEAD